MPRDRYMPPFIGEAEQTPFANVEEAWFWFMQACEAREDGAQIARGKALYNRPCEPNDILTVLQRLHRNRRLTMDHFRIMAHYGRRKMAPVLERKNERRAYYLWREGLEILGQSLIGKGILQDNICNFQRNAR